MMVSSDGISLSPLHAAQSLRGKLDSGQPVAGTFLRYPDASVAELVACQGWDFVIFDAEHGAIDPHHCENLVRACQLQSVAALVRVDPRDLGKLSRFMDAGAAGAHIAGVESAEIAGAALGAMRYSTGGTGTRGLAAVRAAGFGIGESLSDYVSRANRALLAVAQIETGPAIDNLDEILECEGIDIFFLGPTDLSLSLGVPGVLHHPDVVERLSLAAEKILSAGRALGVFASDVASAREWLERGAVYVATGFEGLVRSASIDYLRGVREGQRA
jgi:4-hydroxy-2-oxoheptanedioate aldolase